MSRLLLNVDVTKLSVVELIELRKSVAMAIAKVDREITKRLDTMKDPSK